MCVFVYNVVLASFFHPILWRSLGSGIVRQGQCTFLPCLLMTNRGCDKFDSFHAFSIPQILMSFVMRSELLEAAQVPEILWVTVLPTLSPSGRLLLLRFGMLWAECARVLLA